MVQWRISSFIPGESRGYKLNELTEAINWVSDKDEDLHESVSAGEVLENIKARSSNKNQGPAGEDL